MKRAFFVAILFVLLVGVESSWVERAKAMSKFVWNLKERIPERVREKAGVVFGGVATAYNIKWMWDCTFSGDTNTNRDEKIKGILLNKLEADSSLTSQQLKSYRRMIIAGGPEINVIYSHCVENRWFHQQACILKDLDDHEHENDRWY